MSSSSDAILRNLPPRWASCYGQNRRGIFVRFKVKAVSFELRWIQPGTFLMGSPDEEADRSYDEGTQHTVRISRGFWIGATQVTQAQWEAVMGEGTNPSKFKGEDHPVEKVSWKDCQEYITKLREKVPGLQAELPTEAQWEYACRAGTKTVYAWGDEWTKGQANFENGDWATEQIEYFKGEGMTTESTMPVGTFKPNPWGLLDVHGNVWEWCKDGRRDYSSDPREVLVDPVGPLEEGASRALRGGSWAISAQNCRSAYRLVYAPGYRDVSIGLRLVAGQPA